MKKLIFLCAVLLAAGIFARLAFFTLDSGRIALILRWNGQIASAVTAPGIHAKLPDPIERMVSVDSRGQFLHVPAQDPGAKKGAVPALGYDIVWRISEPVAWWRAFGGSFDETIRELGPDVQKASAEVMKEFPDPALVNRGGEWISGRVSAVLGKLWEPKGVKIESVRVSGIRLSKDDEKAAMDATARNYGGQVQASGKFAEESAGTVRRSAELKARQNIESAFAKADSLRTEADRTAASSYRKIETLTGKTGFAAQLAKARENAFKTGKIEPMPSGDAVRTGEAEK